MSRYHNRQAVADMRAMNVRGQKILIREFIADVEEGTYPAPEFPLMIQKLKGFGPSKVTWCSG